MGRKSRKAAAKAMAQGGQDVGPEKKAKVEQPAKSGKSAEDQSSNTTVIGRIGEFREFFEQSKVELKKVTWPTKKETTNTCIAVLVFSIIMALYLGLVDVAFSRMIEMILS